MSTTSGLEDWLRLDFRDELDAVGPVARRVLARHGLLWPFNVHFHVPLLEAAAGGALLTGVAGDEVLSESRWSRANDVLARRVRPVPRDVLAVSLTLSPRAVRRAVLRRRAPEPFPWLRPAGKRALTRAYAEREAGEPRRYARRLERWLGLRSTVVSLNSLELLSSDAGVVLVHPLADRAFAAALARLAPTGGPVERGRFMREVFGELLPDDVYRRRTKAPFDEAFWGRHARELAAGWAGEVADPAVVDPDALRAEWSKPLPDPHTLTLVQAVWLARSAAERSGKATGEPEAASSQPPGEHSRRAVSEAPSRAARPA